MLFSMLLGP